MTSLSSNTDNVDRPPADAEALEAVREFWNNHIHDWKVARSEPGSPEFFAEIEAYRFEKLHYLPRLVDFGGFAGQKLLEVGCGVANDLSRFAKGGAIVTGVDLAQHSIDLAGQNFEQRGLKGEFHVMNGEDLEFENDSFDVVYCHTVLHFTPDPDSMLSEIGRVLKPGGTAVIMTVNTRSWLNFLHRLMNVEIDHLDAPIFHQISIAEYRQMLEKCFDDVTIVPERFPVRTKVHEGLKARLFNLIFVDVFNLLPTSWTRRSGHHLMAFVRKPG
jgi:2-polyprenyl-3-methyl-5-hydroxy-6-metoxy-1,4-benzoquinol methylase